MTIKEMVEQFKKERKIYDSALVNFTGVEGFDVYNCSIPFEMNGKRYIYGRVERRDEWARSWVRLFEEVGQDSFKAVEDTMIYQLEDPYITFIDGELVMGGTHVRYDGGTVGDYRGYFYKGTDLDDMWFFTSGPKYMKDIRLVQYGKDNKIGVFSRPDGKVGFTTIDKLSDLSSEVIANAPLLPIIDEDEYGGCNQCYALKDGYIGVIGHQAYSDGDYRVYVNMAYVLELETMHIIEKKIIGTRDCYPDVDASKYQPGGLSLKDVAFTSGIVMREDGKVDLYSGLSDILQGRITIDDPFANYR